MYFLLVFYQFTHEILTMPMGATTDQVRAYMDTSWYLSLPTVCKVQPESGDRIQVAQLIKKKKNHELRFLHKIFGNKIKGMMAMQLLKGSVQPGSGRPPYSYLPPWPTHKKPTNVQRIIARRMQGNRNGCENRLYIIALNDNTSQWILRPNGISLLQVGRYIGVGSDLPLIHIQRSRRQGE